MSATPTELRQRRILLAVLVLLVAGAAIAISASVAAEAYATRLEALETTVGRTKTLATLGARVPALEARLAELRAELAAADGEAGNAGNAQDDQTAQDASDGPTPDVDPTVAISRTVERAAAAAGTRLDRVVPSREETSQSVQFQLTGTRRALLATLSGLATDAPNLALETLTIAAGRRAGEARLSMVVRYED